MPATRPRASFEPIPPDLDLKALVESTPNFTYVDRISCDTIDEQGLPAFEKLVLLHVIIGGKPLVIDGFEDRLDPWTFTPKWLEGNCGDKHEMSRNLTTKQNLPLTMGHYLKNMGMLANQFFGKPGAYRDPKRQRVYLKDIDCPGVWQDKLRDQIPNMLYYLNESTGEAGGPGAVPEIGVPGKRLGKGVARAGDLMSSLPPDMRAENLMCYIGHEGTYTPAHREMCASLGQNIMVEASSNVNDDGKPERPGSSVWFMTESKDRHMVSEYWLSVLGHDIEVESHFAQVVAWKKAPFNVYVVEQRPGDFILIPPLAPHQVWNRGTRTMKVAWNRTTVETLEMALNEALPRSRIVCRDEQYKNKAIVYYTLQKYSALITLAQTQASRLPDNAAAHALLTSQKIKQLAKDFKRLFNLYRQMLILETFNPDESSPKGIEYIPFDGNVTCAYCRGNIFNRFLTCPWCKEALGHHSGDGEGDPYDICMDCYAMGRSCACISNLKWVEQFRWKELAAKYENWRQLLISLDGGQVTEKTPLPILEERKKFGKHTLAEVCKEQLKRRPWKDIRKPANESKSEEEEEEEIVVNDNGNAKIKKKKSKTYLKNHSACHVCCHRHPNWKMAQCTKCERMWCYGTLFRGWDKMPIEIMEDKSWECPHCLGICFAGACKKDPRMNPYEPKGTLLGHDTKRVADARSVEALVDFSISNLNWLKEDDPENRAESRRLQRAGLEAQKAKEVDPTLEDEDEDAVEESRIQLEDVDADPAIDPALGGGRYQDDDSFAWRLQQATATLGAGHAPPANVSHAAPEGYAPVNHGGYPPPTANMYPQPDEAGGSYAYPGLGRASSAAPMNGYEQGQELVGGLRPFKKRTHVEVQDGDDDDISMSRHPKAAKKSRLSAAGFRSLDLADGSGSGPASRPRNEAQRQFEKEKERKAIEKAKSEGRFIMLQATLKGKRRVVKLPIPGPKLARIVAQQAAKAALSAGDDADAEHEAEEGAPQIPVDATEADDGEVVLKSDIQPKKPRDPKAYYQQRQQEGYVVAGGAKKALIPVEKDTNYRENHTRPPKAAKKKSQFGPNVDYEEVDIGSEDEGANEDGPIVSGTNGKVEAAKQKEKERRSLPSYLQSRGEDEDFPEQLPAEHRDRHNPQSKGKSLASQARMLGASRQSDGTFKKRPNGVTVKPTTAGKRPAMRPSTSSAMQNEVVDIDDETRDAIEAAGNGEWMDVDEIVDEPSVPIDPALGDSASASITRNGSSATVTAAQELASKPAASKSTQQQQRLVEEQNRRAKLAALDAMDDEDDDDDDEVDEVPARGSVRV